MDVLSLREAAVTSLNEFQSRAVEFVPNLLVALFLLLFGWLMARAAKAAVVRLAKAILSKAGRAKPVAGALEKTRLETTVPALAGAIVYWMVLVAFVALAVERLQLRVATELASRLAYLLPDILVGVLIILGGVLAGSVAYSAIAKAAATAQVAQGQFMGRAVEIGIILVAVAIGAGQIGVESTLVTVIIGAVVISVLGAAALAFGLGARQAVGNLLTTHYLMRLYQVGQTLRIQGIEGRIVEFNQSGVVLETGDGMVLLPGSLFQQEPTVLLRPEGE